MREDKYEVFGMASCPFCDMAKELLSANYLRFLYFHLDKMDSIRAAEIMTDAKMSTVPIIYRNGELVGGYTELRQLLDEES